MPSEVMFAARGLESIAVSLPLVPGDVVGEGEWAVHQKELRLYSGSGDEGWGQEEIPSTGSLGRRQCLPAL